MNSISSLPASLYVASHCVHGCTRMRCVYPGGTKAPEGRLSRKRRKVCLSCYWCAASVTRCVSRWTTSIQNRRPRHGKQLRHWATAPFRIHQPEPGNAFRFSRGYSPTEPIRGFGQLHAAVRGGESTARSSFLPRLAWPLMRERTSRPKRTSAPTAYEYSVTLTRYRTRVEVTPARHSAIYRSHFPDRIPQAC